MDLDYNDFFWNIFRLLRDFRLTWFWGGVRFKRSGSRPANELMNWSSCVQKIVKKEKNVKKRKKGNVQCIVSTCFDALIIITVLWYVIIRGRNVGDSYMCFNGLYWMIILRRVTWCGGCVTQADQLFVVKSAVHRPASFMWRGGEWRGSRTLLTARLLFFDTVFNFNKWINAAPWSRGLLRRHAASLAGIKRPPFSLSAN